MIGVFLRGNETEYDEEGSVTKEEEIRDIHT